jgi:hypothetical protein
MSAEDIQRRILNFNLFGGRNVKRPVTLLDVPRYLECPPRLGYYRIIPGGGGDAIINPFADLDGNGKVLPAIIPAASGFLPAPTVPPTTLKVDWTPFHAGATPAFATAAANAGKLWVELTGGGGTNNAGGTLVTSSSFRIVNDSPAVGDAIALIIYVGFVPLFP